MRSFWSSFRGASAVLLLSAALLLSEPVTATIHPGLHFDPERVGHGFDLQPVGDAWVIVFYTYGADETPTWYLGVLTESDGGVLTGTIDRYRYDAGRFPPQQAFGEPGRVTVEADAGCDVDAPSAATRFSWTIDGESGDWCVQPLLDPERAPAPDFGGLWYGDFEDQGWGLTLDYGQTDDGPVAVQVLFYFDADGSPRWALGVASTEDGVGSGPLETFRGYCRTCESRDLTASDAGTVGHALDVERGRPGGTVEIDVTYEPLPGGSWIRTGHPLVALSDPAPGLIPLPERLDPDAAVAIFGVDVVPLTGDEDKVLANQTVLVRDGVIEAIGPRAATAIPDDAWRIDGRGLYLGPGLQDMHTHFTFGGVQTMQEAGLLFIANGVTTVLNMGDGLNQDLPGTDDLFASGERIGPTVVAGLLAYGPADGRGAAVTVATPAEATAHAELGKSLGYDLIKVYNQVSPDVFRQFLADGDRLGMPVIGHLPKQLSMEESLSAGQRMIAHVAEVYFTLLGNQPREDLLPAAADLMLAHGVYLTDTLTASESFAAMFGGNEANFTTYSQREGVQYLPLSFVRSGWRNWFDSSTIQPAGSQPGQLDDRLVFFKQMVKHFHDAGVPLLLGTDSPGHVGVISGFSVHENLRLYDEIGIAPGDGYRIAARNAGRMLGELLPASVPAGRVAVGQRADLLLLEADPQVDYRHLARPLGVMTRGRFYSRDLLDAELEALDESHLGPFRKDDGAAWPSGAGHWCTDAHH